MMERKAREESEIDKKMTEIPLAGQK